MNIVDGNGAGRRKQQWAKQHDRGNALQHAAEHREGDNRHLHETGATAGHGMAAAPANTARRE
jgi:hypothetical protein